MNYEFTKDCEIMNCTFEAGEIVSEKSVQFYPTIMQQTEKEVTHLLTQTGGNLIKAEAEKKPEKKAKKKAEKPDEETTENE